MKTIQLQSKPMPEQSTLDTDETEGVRRATGVPSVSGSTSLPDPDSLPLPDPRYLISPVLVRNWMNI